MYEINELKTRFDRNIADSKNKGKKYAYIMLIPSGIYFLYAMLDETMAVMTFALTLIAVFIISGLIILGFLFFNNTTIDKKFIAEMNEAVVVFRSDNNAENLLTALIKMQSTTTNMRAINIWKLNLAEALYRLKNYTHAQEILESLQNVDSSLEVEVVRIKDNLKNV